MSVVQAYTDHVPVYVTRETAGRTVTEYRQRLVYTTLAIGLITFNIIIWGLIGLWQAVEFIAHG